MFNRINGRISQSQADYILAIVRRPPGWYPDSIESAPQGSEILEEHLVASFAEAEEDLVRCNQIALRCNINKWAVLMHPASDI